MSRVAESSGKISRRQITLPDVRLYRARARAAASLRIRVLSRQLRPTTPRPTVHHARRNTTTDRPTDRRSLAGWCSPWPRELLNSSYLLLKSGARSASGARACCAGRNSIETDGRRWQKEPRRDGRTDGRTGRMSHSACWPGVTTERRGIRRILCPPGLLVPPPSGDYLLPTSNTDIFVGDYGDSAERSIWCAGARRPRAPSDETRR